MTDKTLGQVAHASDPELRHVVRDVLNDLNAGPRVVDVTDDEWEKAAWAVLELVEQRHALELAAECAAIEAAKAFYLKWKEDKGEAHLQFNQMIDAIEALEEVEGE